MENFEDIYDEDFLKRIDEELEEADRLLEDLYKSELYRDASLYYLNKEIKKEI